VLVDQSDTALAKVTGLSSIRSSTVMITMEKAQKLIEAGIVKAKQIGQPMNIAVVDAGANLTAFAHGWGAAWQHRHCHQQGLHREGLRYLDAGS
jgi:heme-degrading protein